MTRVECAVCAEDRPSGQIVECGSCAYKACKTCSERYILSRPDDPHCMNCKRRWGRSDLLTQFSASFVNTKLRDWRKQVLFQRELAMLHASRPHVERECKRRENVALLRDLRAQRSAISRRLTELNHTIHALQRQLIPPLENSARCPFVHRCAQENCRGFVSTAWKCGVCSKYTCSQCNAPLGFARDADAHVCNEADRETMRLLRNDSRHCPGCGECIFRVSGCDQMWCTMCATAFSWKTGLVINGSIHNPHFYDWLQRQSGTQMRNPADIPCGGMPTYRELLSTIATCVHSQPRSYILNMHRLIVHVQTTEEPRYRTTARTSEEANMDLRILYMLNEIDEAKFCTKIQQREKAVEKRRDIFEVLQLITQVGADKYREAVLSGDCDGCVKDLIELFHYANEALARISALYDCVVPQFDLATLTVSTTRP